MKYTLASSLRRVAKSVTEQEVMEFFKKNPNPSDDDVHKWANKKGLNVHKVEQAIYKLATKYVKLFTGGLSNTTRNFDKSKVDPKELRMGIKVEMEHTGDRDLSEKIALDHLAEMPNYYTALKKMESEHEK